MATLITATLLLFGFVCISQAGTLNNEILWNFFDTDLSPGESDSVGNHWAVLVAGSASWYNYRHQADICHAYHVLTNHGVSPDRIITLMFDDIAHNEENPTPGIVINHPNGSDVYGGVKIDYTKEDVTPDVFLAVLRGDAEAVKGRGSGRVLKSGPKDHVFVNFADHGAPGILAFPSGMLGARDLMKTIMTMYNKKMYKQLVLYIEACESGSMFDRFLPNNISAYATTAANPTESSYACYYDAKRNTYLGDVYSVKWMEDSDVENLGVETLEKQFEIVKKETNTSHVQEYGDMKIATEPVADFQGGKKSKPIGVPHAPLDAVASEQVPLAILGHRLTAAQSVEEEIAIVAEIEQITKLQQSIDSTVKHIVAIATADETQARRVLEVKQGQIDFDCYEPVSRHFHENCFDLSQHDFALRRMYALVNLCHENIAKEVTMSAIDQICSVNRK